MAKITFIGAGSTVFARNLLGDILGHAELAGSEIALFDIDAERLALEARDGTLEVQTYSKIAESLNSRWTERIF